MEGFSAETFTAALALIGAVVLVSALLSGIIEKSGLPQVAFFLALGAALGPAGLNVLNIGLDSPVLRVVATLSLVLVLFTDAVTLNLNEVRKNSKLALLVCGPGTLFSAVLLGVASWLILGLHPAAAAIVGAALASTDPVLLKNLVRLPGVPNSTKLALRLEGGMNDIVLLPIVLIALVFLEQSATPTVDTLVRLGLDLLILGPGAGIGVGLLSVATMDLIRRRFGIRRDYESLYSLGVAFTAYAAAEAVHGSGFLAAFAAGLTISALDVELCDCFLEYGETTSEMALLLTFVLFGGSLIWSGFGVLTPVTIGFAVVALLVRPVAFSIALAPIKLIRRSRWLIAWYGPRGLSSLLLVLLAVFEKAPGSEYLFQVCCLVVLFSILMHGFSPAIVSRTRARKKSGTVPATPLSAHPVEEEGPEAEGAATGMDYPVPGPGEGPPAGISPAKQPLALVSLDRLRRGTLRRSVQKPPPPATPPATAEPTPVVFPPAQTVGVETPTPAPAAPAPAQGNGRVEEEDEDAGADLGPRTSQQFITLTGVKHLRQKGEKVVLLDVRTERTFDQDQQQAAGAVRINPMYAVKQAQEKGLSKQDWLIAYCA
jgi:NhaP-type Na+/H+ or K+/H+ antiporter